MYKEEILKGVEPEARERIYRQDRVIEVVKWFIGSVALTAITTIVSWQFKDREIRLQELSQLHQIAQEEQRLKHQISLERKATEQRYLSEFIEYALSSDINLRIRFAHYFASISSDNELESKWKRYYSDLLDAKAELAETTNQVLTASSKIGGTEAISASGTALNPERIVVKGGFDVPLSTYRRWHRDRGWSDVGFHFIIRPDGTVENGRSLERKPAFISGQNKGTIAVNIGCLPMEGLSSGDVCQISDEQYRATVDLVRRLSDDYDIPLDLVLDSQEIDERKRPSYLGGLAERVRNELKIR